MKKLLTISCAAILAITLCVTAATSIAFADIEKPEPSGITYDFDGLKAQIEIDVLSTELDGISDYTVAEFRDDAKKPYKKFAFTENGKVIVYTCRDSEDGTPIDMNTSDGKAEYDGGVMESLTIPGADITKLEFSGDGGLYCMSSSSELFLVQSGSDGLSYASVQSFVFTEYDDGELIAENDTYHYRIEEGRLQVFNFDSPEESCFLSENENFSHLKKLGDEIYVVGDEFYMLESGALISLSFTYNDYDTAIEIDVADTYELLKITAETVQAAKIASDALLIPVELSAGTDTFTIPGRIRRFSEVKKETGLDYALLLMESGDAALIFYGEQTYLADKNEIEDYYSGAVSGVDGTCYALMDTNVYSMPYPSDATTVGTLTKGSAARVTGVTDGTCVSFYDTFYKVTYTDDAGETESGYVLAGLMSDYEFDAGSAGAGAYMYSEFTDKDNLTTCTIVIVLVAVVMVAAIYLTVVLTSDKRKRVKHQSDTDSRGRES
ncbi:MAG: hypothetical protein LUD29_02855 [Clostridia bacterium]|nr:hypothetical protein [Clostridia bacterium]